MSQGLTSPLRFRRPLTQLALLRRGSPALDRLLGELARVGRVALVGGAARDWVLGSSPRDLDFAIACSPAALAEVLGPWTPGRTRLGGFRLRLGVLDVDLWALETTWAFANGWQGEQSFHGLSRTAFFDADGFVVTLDGEVFADGFLRAHRNRSLGLMFRPNPYPELCVARAAVLHQRYGLAYGDDVLSYVRARIAAGLTPESACRAHAAHYQAGSQTATAALFALLALAAVGMAESVLTPTRLSAGR